MVLHSTEKPSCSRPVSSTFPKLSKYLRAGNMTTLTNRSKIADLRVIVAVARDLGDAIGCSPLKGAAAIFLTVLDEAKIMPENQALLRNALQRTTQTLLSLNEQLPKIRANTGLDWNDWPQSLKMDILSLATTLDKLCAVIRSYAAKSRFKRLIRRHSIRNEIQRIESDLGESREMFKISTLIGVAVDVHRSISDAKQASPLIDMDHPDLRVFSLSRLRIISDLKIGDLYSPSLCHAEYTDDSGNKVFVVVRKYSSGYDIKMYLSDLKRYQSLLHYNLPRIIGKSHKNAVQQLLVFEDCLGTSARDFLSSKVYSHPNMDSIGGFMASVTMMKEAASALQSLRVDLRLSKVDLLRFCDTETFYVDRSGKLIVGRNILWNDHVPSETLDSSDLDKYLKNQFWVITMELLYGGENAIDWGDWSSIQTNASFLRPLLTFASYDCPTFKAMAHRLMYLHNQLTNPVHGPLNYRTIRKSMLQAKEGFDLSNIFTPPFKLDVCVGDIGYVTNGSFVRLRNICQPGGFQPEHKVTEWANYTHSSSGSHVSEKISNNTIRHSFDRPFYVEINRHDNPAQFSKSPKISKGLWSLFTLEAPEIIRELSREHSVTVTDLILVTAVWNNYRYASYDFIPRESVNARQPSDVQFLEFENSLPGQQWGEWNFESNAEDVNVLVFRHPQRIGFLQLEDGECQID